MMMDLRLENSYRQVLRLTLPISASFIIPQISLCFNTIFQSHLGLESLGNAGIVGMFYLIFTFVGIGLNTGLQTYLSVGAGKNDWTLISKYLTNGLWLNVWFALVALLFTFFCIPWLIHASVRSADTADVIIAYLNVRMLGLPFLYGMQLITVLLTATNRTRWLPLGTGVEAVVNIFGDYAFIFGKFGFTALGFLGAAYASIVADTLACLTLLMVAYRTSIFHYVRLKWHFLIIAKMKHILYRSLPLIVQHGTSFAAYFLFFLLIKRNSDTIHIALTQPLRIMYGSFGVGLFALGATTNTMVGNFIGQKKTYMLHAVVQKIRRVSLAFACVSVLLMLASSSYFFMLFNQGTLLYQHATFILLIISGCLMMISVGMVSFNVLIGWGMARQAFLIEIVAILLYTAYIWITLEIYHTIVDVAWIGELLFWIVMSIYSVKIANKKLQQAKQHFGQKSNFID